MLAGTTSRVLPPAMVPATEGSAASSTKVAEVASAIRLAEDDEDGADADDALRHMLDDGVACDLAGLRAVEDRALVQAVGDVTVWLPGFDGAHD
jgi:hypothetical protein